MLLCHGRSSFWWLIFPRNGWTQNILRFIGVVEFFEVCSVRQVFTSLPMWRNGSFFMRHRRRCSVRKRVAMSPWAVLLTQRAYTATIATCEMLLRRHFGQLMSTAKMLIPAVPWRFAHAHTLFYWKSHSPINWNSNWFRWNLLLNPKLFDTVSRVVAAVQLRKHWQQVYAFWLPWRKTATMNSFR